MEYIDKYYLKSNPNHIFVFGDNTLRKGLDGAALFRNEVNSYGFITKKYPNNEKESFYTVETYLSVYLSELSLLKNEMSENKNKTYLISKLGSGLANRYGIFEGIIELRIKKDLARYTNVRWLF